MDGKENKMIEQLKPTPFQPNIPNKEDCVNISRKGVAPKGEYCDNCVYFKLDLEARINSWNEQVERAVEVAKCLFFGDLLVSEKDKTPCGITFNRYKKCVDCKLQTDEKFIKQAKKIGISTEELVQTMKEIIVINLMENLKESSQNTEKTLDKHKL